MVSCEEYRSKVVRKLCGIEVETILPKTGGGIYLFLNGRFDLYVECNDHEKAHKIAELRVERLLTTNRDN